MIKISIITVNYNNIEGLKRTVESVVSQAFQKFEYIIIDGGSTDGSAAYIQSQNRNIDFWVSESDTGIYNAMNKGIVKSKGEYLLFLNSGDVLVKDQELLKKCGNELTEDIVAFDCLLERDKRMVGMRTHIKKPTLFYVYKNGLKHQSTFIRRTLFQKIGGYNEKYSIASDYEFWIRCFLQPEITSRGVAIPLAIYELGGMSEIVGWQNDFNLIHYELLPHLIDDFEHFQKLLPYENSRILKRIIKIQKMFRKIFN